LTLHVFLGVLDTSVQSRLGAAASGRHVLVCEGSGVRSWWAHTRFTINRQARHSWADAQDLSGLGNAASRTSGIGAPLSWELGTLAARQMP
jgi:hypothetical protein